MTEKRFSIKEGSSIGLSSIYTDNGKVMTQLEVLDVLINQHETIQSLKKENEQLKKQNALLKRLYDLDSIHQQFYVDSHWIKNKQSKTPIANMFNYHEAKVVCGMLNDMLQYKLLVRKHKEDLEAIYGKPIREQLKEVI